MGAATNGERKLMVRVRYTVRDDISFTLKQKVCTLSPKSFQPLAFDSLVFEWTNR